MMSYNKYKRGCQHLNGGHQRTTYKTKKKKNKKLIIIIIIIIFTLRLTQSNQWVGVDHAARIHSLNSPPMTINVEKNMIVMMTCKTCLKHMNNVSIYCGSLRKKKQKKPKNEGTRTRHTKSQTKIIVI